jgi:hypothetical protein
MNFTGILVALSIITAIFGSYCATRNAGNLRSFKTWEENRTDNPHLHFITRRQLSELGNLKSHQVLFQLQGSQQTNDLTENLPKSLGITVEELGKCIPWIPDDNRIILSSIDGFSASLLGELRKLPTKRELFLIKDARELPESFSPTEIVEARI